MNKLIPIGVSLERKYPEEANSYTRERVDDNYDKIEEALEPGEQDQQRRQVEREQAVDESPLKCGYGVVEIEHCFPSLSKSDLSHYLHYTEEYPIADLNRAVGGAVAAKPVSEKDPSH